MSDLAIHRSSKTQSCVTEKRGTRLQADLRPTVSVVIPTHNRAALVIRAIDSALRQTVQDIEIIVVDDGSDDHTIGLIRALRDTRIEILRHEQNKGAAAARNTGVAAAAGKYIAFLDSDDQWANDKLAKQIAFLDQGGGRFRACCSGFAYLSNTIELSEVRIPKHPLTFSDFLMGCRCSPGSTLVADAALFEEVGPFNEDLLRLEDWDWLLRCAQLTPVGVVQESLATVDARTNGNARYELVRQAAKRIEQSWRTSSGPHRSLKSIRMLRGTLWNEIAASAYLAGRYELAVRSFFVSAIFLPERRWQFYKRIVSRLWRDISRATYAASIRKPSDTILEVRKMPDNQAVLRQ